VYRDTKPITQHPCAKESSIRGKSLKTFEEAGAFKNSSKSWEVDFSKKFLVDY
jgi:hypothetical protein